MKNKKNKGSSLIYILVLLSVISLAGYGYIYYSVNKQKIIKLDKYKVDKKILKKRLIKKENREIEKLKKGGIQNYLEKKGKDLGYDIEYNSNGVEVYFNSFFNMKETITIIEEESDDCVDHINMIYDDECIVKKEIKTTKLVYDHLVYNPDKISIGGYKIEKISGYSLPLTKNKNYGTLTVIYSKKILDNTIYLEEKLEFSRINGKYVPLTKSYKFLNEVEND